MNSFRPVQSENIFWDVEGSNYRSRDHAHLKLANLSIEWKRIEKHWANECDVSGLARINQTYNKNLLCNGKCICMLPVVNLLFIIYPQSSKLA